MDLAGKSPLVSLGLAAVLLLSTPGWATAEPRVVATIPPIHSLVAAVMADIGQPHLLVKGGASPHTYALRPSDAEALSHADVIFWVGDGLENFLVKSLAALGGGADVVALSKASGLRLLASREGGVWEEDEHEQDPHHGATDPHVWLDPANAQAMVGAIVTALSRRDTPHAPAYAANGARVIDRLAGLKSEVGAILAPIAKRPFMVFHDAYQYFETAFGLNAVGAISVAPDRLPGAGRLGELRDRLRSADVRCIFREPQFTPKLAESLAQGTGARVGVLDPLGAGLAAGPELYFRLIRGDAEALKGCLEAKPAG